MMKQRYLVALGAISATLAACGGGTVGEPGSGGSSNNTGGTGATATGGTGATATGGTGATATGGTGATATGGTGATATGGTGAGGTDGGTGGIGGEVACVDGVPASTQIPRLLNRQYDAVMRDLLGVTAVAAANNQKPSALLYADYNGPMNIDAWRLYRDAAAKIAAEVMAGPNRTKFISCTPVTATCLAESVRTFGRKAFRRPITMEDEMRFAALASTTPAGTLEEVAQTTLEAFLVSPSFLQINELSPVVEGTAIKLSPYEVAARLSFLLWGSIPDDVLSAAADADQLQTKEQILAQAQRMVLVRDKTASLVAEFHRHYLDMANADSHWWKIKHDTTKYPHYSEAAEPAYMAEIDRFFEEVAFNGGTFKDLFLSPIAFVNKDTAPVYGLDPAQFGTELEKVELDPTQRPGFLTRAGFLQSYSHFDGTSPILRGAYITVNLIGVNPGQPDPEAFLTPAPPGEYLTEREYVEALTDQPSCRGCHLPFVNPPGFVLENYDSVGKWQTVDPRGGPIDATAIVTFAEGVEKEITSPRQMMEEIGLGASARRIYAKRWVNFATGRLANANDACIVDELDVKLSQEGYTVLNMLTDITQADSFRLRVRATP